jgi:UrcA family protein
MRNKAIRLAIASVFFVITCTGASAAPTSKVEAEARVKHVKTTDLDLSKPADRKMLDHRIAWAMMDVCPLNFGPSLGEMMRAGACRRKALRGTQPQVAALIDNAKGVKNATALASADVR